jgi:hypothetical protein
MDYWLAARRPGVAPTTYRRYRLDVSYLTRCLGAVRLADLTAFHVARLYQQMGEGGYSTDARTKAGVRLRQLLEKAQEMGLVKYNVAKMVLLPRNAEERAQAAAG